MTVRDAVNNIYKIQDEIGFIIGLKDRWDEEKSEMDKNHLENVQYFLEELASEYWKKELREND